MGQWSSISRRSWPSVSTLAIYPSAVRASASRCRRVLVSVASPQARLYSRRLSSSRRAKSSSRPSSPKATRTLESSCTASCEWASGKRLKPAAVSAQTCLGRPAEALHSGRPSIKPSETSFWTCWRAASGVIPSCLASEAVEAGPFVLIMKSMRSPAFEEEISK